MARGWRSWSVPPGGRGPGLALQFVEELLQRDAIVDVHAARFPKFAFYRLTQRLDSPRAEFRIAAEFLNAVENHPQIPIVEAVAEKQKRACLERLGEYRRNHA